MWNRVRRRTWNAVWIWGDHPPRLTRFGRGRLFYWTRGMVASANTPRYQQPPSFSQTKFRSTTRLETRAMEYKYNASIRALKPACTVKAKTHLVCCGEKPAKVSSSTDLDIRWRIWVWALCLWPERRWSLLDQVEVTRKCYGRPKTFWRANRCLELSKGAKDSSNRRVAGFLRNFP